MSHPIKTAKKYNRVIGIERAIKLTGSPDGVMTAAATKMHMIAIRHCLMRVRGVTMPTSWRNRMRTGLRKPAPKASAMRVTRDTYFDTW